MSNISLQTLVDELAASRALDLRGYKHSTLERRVRKRMFQLGIAEFSGYLEKLKQEPAELNELLNIVLINVTEFFRDPQAWEIMRTEILPRLFSKLKPGDSFRAWSAGCATGEEPLSLAILVAEQLGGALVDYDIKIYGTDIDEDALNVARRGEYASEKLRRVRPEWREKYFAGGTLRRINRDLRRLVIFGRSNLMSNAPISHCDLIICRNVLIYFDTAAQKQVLSRLHYALEPNGVLWLGKAESKLSDSRLFQSLNSRWRMFERLDLRTPVPVREKTLDENSQSEEVVSRAQQELHKMQLQQRSILETVRSGVIVLDESDIVREANDSALSVWGLTGAKMLARRIQNTELVLRCPELTARLHASHSSPEPVSFQCRAKGSSEERIFSITLRPITDGERNRLGTLFYTEDVTDREKLQSTVEQLEATSEELQSANEELETTNEELQSTNEELETTNEELQSTNEELETTNEELQSLNEELENMNEELEVRTRELHHLSHRYAETLQSMPWPVVLVDNDETIQLWNSAAQRLFGVGATSVVGVRLDQLPIEAALRRTIIRKCKAALRGIKAGSLRHLGLNAGGSNGYFDLHFTPIARENSNGSDVAGVLIMFSPCQPGSGSEGRTKMASGKSQPRASQGGNSGGVRHNRKQNHARPGRGPETRQRGPRNNRRTTRPST